MLDATTASADSAEASPPPAPSEREAVRARVRSRQTPAPAGAARRIALLIALCVHALLAWWLYALMRQPAGTDSGRIEVRLIEAVPPEPALPEPSAAAAVHAPRLERANVGTPRTSNIEPTSPRTREAAEQAPAAPAIHIYDPDGSIALPAERVAADDPSHFVAPSTAPSALMARHRPLKIRPNYFAKAWRAPENETLLGETLRKIYEFADDNLTAKKEFTTPWGSKIKCEAGFLIVMARAGCGWGYPPPPGGRPIEHWKPATELDEE